MAEYVSNIDKLKISINKKLEIGRKRIKSAENNPDMMCLILISYDGALEDYFRLALSQKVPDKEEVLLDKNATKWKDLLEYGTQYLGLTPEDYNFIKEANNHRNVIGHGDEFDWNQTDLIKYYKVESSNFVVRLDN